MFVYTSYYNLLCSESVKYIIFLHYYVNYNYHTLHYRFVTSINELSISPPRKSCLCRKSVLSEEQGLPHNYHENTKTTNMFIAKEQLPL